MKHRATGIADAGSKPIELSRFGCKGIWGQDIREYLMTSDRMALFHTLTM